MANRLIAYVFDPWGHIDGGWSWVGMTLMMLLLVALVVWVVIPLAKPASGAQHPNALEILEQRYAWGEIDEEEFLTRRDILAEVGSKR